MSNPSHLNDDATRIAMHEGSVCLPIGFEDRSANLFVPHDPQRHPNLSVARDRLAPGETLEEYVDRQLGMLRTRLTSHRLLERSSERLGAGDYALLGERLDSHYKNGAQAIRQRQAAFDLGAGRALIFSAATPGALDAPFDLLWRAWLDSFRRAAVASAA